MIHHIRTSTLKASVYETAMLDELRYAVLSCACAQSYTTVVIFVVLLRFSHLVILNYAIDLERRLMQQHGFAIWHHLTC